MSQASDTFAESIKDAAALLDQYDRLEKRTPEDGEFLKRAGLIMAFTAWETYVEDRICEAMKVQMRLVDGSFIGKFVNDRLEGELKRFNNPSSDKTKRLFLDYLGIDVTADWKWSGLDSSTAKKHLDSWISKRGEVVHRAKTPGAHLVKRDDLDKVIRFLTCLVEATDKALLAA